MILTAGDGRRLAVCASVLVCWIMSCTRTIAFTVVPFSSSNHRHMIPTLPIRRRHNQLDMASDDDNDGPQKAASMVTGEELEMMLTEWDQPMVIDAYATWCGPCLLMAPEFEKAAQDLQGKVRFVKLDTDQNEDMATKLNIMGLPTLLFLDQYKAKEGEEVQEEAKAVLKGKVEGALEQKTIADLCEHYFFDGPRPELLQ